MLTSLALRVAIARGYMELDVSGAMRCTTTLIDGAIAGEASRNIAVEILWTSDPVTGHYRLANYVATVNHTDLRAVHVARTYAHA